MALSAAIGNDLALLFTDEDGLIVDGFMADLQTNTCIWFAGSVSGNAYGALLVTDPPESWLVYGGFLATSAEPADQGYFEVTSEVSGGIGETVMGASHWLWGVEASWYGSVALEEPTAIDVLAPVEPNVLTMGHIATDGTRYYADRVFVNDMGGFDGWVEVTDGASEPTPVTAAPSGAIDHFAMPAGSHLAWFRGFNATGVNAYEAVEVWARTFPVGEDYKVADYDWSSVYYGQRAAASGRIAFSGRIGDGKPDRVIVADLARGVRIEHPWPDVELAVSTFIGMSDLHVYVDGKDPRTNMGRAIYRFSVTDGP